MACRLFAEVFVACYDGVRASYRREKPEGGSSKIMTIKTVADMMTTSNILFGVL